MAEFNELNNLHLTRPATVVFRKPLATSEEMSRQLNMLLKKYAPRITEKVRTSKYTKGKLEGLMQAVLWTEAMVWSNEPASTTPKNKYRPIEVPYDCNIVWGDSQIKNSKLIPSLGSINELTNKPTFLSTSDVVGTLIKAGLQPDNFLAKFSKLFTKSTIINPTWSGMVPKEEEYVCYLDIFPSDVALPSLEYFDGIFKKLSIDNDFYYKNLKNPEGRDIYKKYGKPEKTYKITLKKDIFAIQIVSNRVLYDMYADLTNTGESNNKVGRAFYLANQQGKLWYDSANSVYAEIASDPNMLKAFEFDVNQPWDFIKTLGSDRFKSLWKTEIDPLRVGKFVYRDYQSFTYAQEGAKTFNLRDFIELYRERYLKRLKTLLATEIDKIKDTDFFNFALNNKVLLFPQAIASDITNYQRNRSGSGVVALAGTAISYTGQTYSDNTFDKTAMGIIGLISASEQQSIGLTGTTETFVNEKVRTKNNNITFGEFKQEFYQNIFKNVIKPKIERLNDFNKNKQQDIVVLSTSKVELEDLFLNSTNFKEIEEVLYSDYSGFYITSETDISANTAPFTGTQISDEIIDNITSFKGATNRDIASMNISRSVMGSSIAELSIKNLSGRYTYTSGVDYGSFLFEPMDEVFIFLPGLDNTLKLSFRGLLNTVSQENSNGYSMIYISAECAMKNLRVNRTNSKPSYSPEEAKYKQIHPFNVPPEFFKSVEYWVPYMFLQSNTFGLCMLSPELQTNEPLFTLKSKGKVPVFKDSLLEYLWYSTGVTDAEQKVAGNALTQLLNDYVDSEILDMNSNINTPRIEHKIVPLLEAYNDIRLRSDKNKGSIKSLPKVNYSIYKQRKGSTNRTLAAQLLGTVQPAYSLSLTEINLRFSEYRTNYDILMETAEKFNFFIYTNRSGVIQFRPPQLDLYNINTDGYSVKYDKLIQNSDYSYDNSVNTLNKQTCIVYRANTDDSNIVTWLPLQGNFSIPGNVEGDAVGAVSVVENKVLSEKYGLRTQQLQVVTGLEDVRSTTIYAMALMDRQNKGLLTANAVTMGFGDYDINRTMYSAIDNSMFLCAGITYRYEPGKSFTCDMALTFGRKPLFALPLVKGAITGQARIEDIDLDELSKQLKLYFDTNKITAAYYNQTVALVKIAKEFKYYPVLSSFIFNGLVWDGVSSISFEDLMGSYYSIFKADGANMFAIAVGIDSKSTGKMNLGKFLTSSREDTDKTVQRAANATSDIKYVASVESIPELANTYLADQQHS